MSPLFEVNRIVQPRRSRASSRQTAVTLAESCVVADKNAKFSTICFSHWKGSWYMLERIESAFDGWLSFGLSGQSFSMYRRVTVSIRLLWNVPLDITLFMMALYSCVFEILFTKARKSRRWGFFENRVWLDRATVFELSGAFFVSFYQGMKIWCGFTYSWFLRRWTQPQNEYELWLHYAPRYVEAR